MARSQFYAPSASLSVQAAHIRLLRNALHTPREPLSVFLEASLGCIHSVGGTNELRDVCWRADLLRFTAYRTDKGSLDKGGLPQPAFLNFDASLLYPPAHTIQVGSCASLHLASCA